MTFSAFRSFSPNLHVYGRELAVTSTAVGLYNILKCSISDEESLAFMIRQKR